MADILQALQSAGAPDTSDKPADIGAALASIPDQQQATAPGSPPSRAERFVQGLSDLPVGLGQIAEHVAETPLNGLRSVIRGSLNAAGMNDAAQLFQPVNTDDFDRIVQKREQDYQQARLQANQTGIDWWRLGGNIADPINYIGGGPVASTVRGRMMQAGLQGAAINAAQPSTAPGSFWWDKTKQAASGLAAGGILSGTIEATMPLLRLGINAVRRTIGSTVSTAATPAADVVVHDALRAKGVDPGTIDVNILQGMKQEVQTALEHNAQPSAEAIANRARAESLPVPVRLMRGQATGDPMAFSTEQNLRGVQGVGESITQRLQEQNAAFIQNLDAIGAKNAPDSVSTGSYIASKVQGYWDQLQARKDALYSAVRNNAGQSAAVDQFTIAKQIRDTLDTPEASHVFDILPAHIKATIEDMEDGRLPLTIARAQSIDKIWGKAERGADGSTAYAIGQARRILNTAPIQDNVGDKARAAYLAAKQAHAQQMALIDKKMPNGMPNPQFQQLVKSVVMDGTPPEKIFQQHFMGEAPSVAGKSLAFLQTIDPSAPELVGRTLMGEIKRQALSSATDERGAVSQSILNGWARDPVKSARMDALLPAPAVNTFRNLAATVEAAKRVPVASTVNTSNTGAAVVNAAVSAVKQGALGQITKRLPIVRDIAQGVEAAGVQTKVQQALQPGVTLNSLISATPKQAASRRVAARLGLPATLATQQASKGVGDE